ncbi:hypothetical protein C0J52_26722 [Blattella germanica]|nr:hypothetical protein C0J52_26722 [Blattella germanica]
MLQNMDVNLSYFLLFLLVFVLLQIGSRGKVLKSDGREMVKVHKFFSDECDALKCGKPTISVTSIVERSAAATGISSRSVLRILKEHKNAEASGGRLQTPGKKRLNRRTRKTEIDSFTAAAIR